jgi:hypothetical protein
LRGRHVDQAPRPDRTELSDGILAALRELADDLKKSLDIDLVSQGIP